MSLGNILVSPVADVHHHLREGERTIAALIECAVHGGADVIGAMPNTTKGLLTAADVIDYVRVARKFADPARVTIMPFVMLTEYTTVDELKRCRDAGIMNAKIYPLNRTTKSQNGVMRYGSIIHLVQVCGELGIKCHFHPEHPWAVYDNRDAEFGFLAIARIFLEQTNATLVWEHGTDATCIPFWKDMAKTGRFFVTLTAHHLLTDEDEVFGDVRAVCKPPIKTRRDRHDLVALVYEDHRWVMAGSDSAFHDVSKKHVDTGCCACGATTSPYLLPFYASGLRNLLVGVPSRVDIFMRFTSGNARVLHGLPEPTRFIYLAPEEQVIPARYPIADETALCFWAGRKIDWKIAHRTVL